MEKFNFSAFMQGVKKGMIANTPAILTGIGIAGMCSAIVMAVCATPKALDKIEDIKARTDEEDKKTRAKEMATKVAPLYLPTIITTGFSIACLIGATKESNKRNAALATAYSLSETALRDYQSKVVEALGEKKEQKVRDEVAKEQLTRTPVTNSQVVIASKGDVLFYEPLTKRYFTSDIETVRSAYNDLNLALRNESYVSVPDYLYFLKITPGINDYDNDEFDYLGWNIDNGYVEYNPTVSVADDGRPCLILKLDKPPQYHFDHFGKR